MELIEKAAYLQGLMEGLGLDESTKEGKVLHAMSDLLAEMAASIKAMEQDVTQAESELDGLREDVEELQADFYEDGEDDADAPCYEVDCPGCGETVYVTEEDLDAGEAFCPNCGCTFEVALDDTRARRSAPTAAAPLRWPWTTPRKARARPAAPKMSRTPATKSPARAAAP